MKSKIKKKEFSLDAVDSELLCLRYGGHYKNKEPKVPEIRYSDDLVATLPSLMNMTYYVRTSEGKKLCEGNRGDVAKFIFEKISKQAN